MWSLVLGAGLLGLAGTPHCAAMCGPACAALTRSSQAGAAQPAAGLGATAWAFHGARAISYAAVGAALAGGVGLLSTLGEAAAWLRPVWALLHVGALIFGFWLLLKGEQPPFLASLGRSSPATLPSADGQVVTWYRRSPSIAPAARAFSAGLLWAAWPCGLLQSAFVLAALANTPWGGAAAMLAFAMGSAAGLQLAPWAAARWVAATGAGQGGEWAVRASVRVAGAALLAASAWALGHDLWPRFLAYCSS